MHFAALIDAIVRQTTVLIAQLATTAGIRAPLAHIANQVFLDLVRELESQGVGRKVAADMFGLALRSYQRKVRRIAESLTERNRTLWEAVLDFVRAEGTVTRRRVLERFAYDDDEIVKAVLHDLGESGLIFSTGRAAQMVYMATGGELAGAVEDETTASTAAFVWMLVYRHGPCPIDTLLATARLEEAEVREALVALEADGNVERSVEGGSETWRSAGFLLPQGTTVGWEAAVFHHYQAMVTALVDKLQRGQTQSRHKDVVGGSTYEFLVWQGHPQEEEVFGLLREVRERVSALRAENTAHNDRLGRPEDATRVSFYVGQSAVLGAEYEEGEE